MVIMAVPSNQLDTMKRSSHFQHAAFTLVETMVGAAVAVIGIGGVAVLNSAHLRYVQSARQSNAATLVLQERVEAMRLTDWKHLTDSLYLKDTLYASPTASAGPLGRFTEELKVEAYEPVIDASRPAPSPVLVQRKADGTRVALMTGSGLATQRLAKVDVKVTWTGADGRERVRATTSLISNGGISKLNLPGFGGSAAGTFPGPPAQSTPAPGTPAPGTPAPATPAPATPAPATPAPGNNGNGQGNVGGKPGKK